MKYLIFIPLFFLTSCLTMNVETPEGYKASYTRIGNQNIQGLMIEKEGNATSISLEKANSDSKLLEAIKALLQVPQ